MTTYQLTRKEIEGLSKDDIEYLSKNGKLRLMRIMTKYELPEYQQFEHLKNETTWISQASRDYGIPIATIVRWADGGIVRICGKAGNKKLLSSQDMAYAAHIYHRDGGGTQGVRLFNDDGTPYTPKAETLPLAE